MYKTLALLTVLLIAPLGRADDKWVTLKGQVVFDGTPAAPAEIKVTADPGHCLSKGPLFDETWIVSKRNNGVKNVFVWLANDGKSASGAALPVHPSLASPAKPIVEMDQPCCAFAPRVQAVREGQTLVVKNSSPVTHNVRWEPSSIKNHAGNDTIVAGKETQIKGLKQETFAIPISCSLHPWMRGVIRVFDSPYYAVTDQDGKFEIKLAPVGKWRLFVWHEGAGWKDGRKGRNGTELEIKPGETQDLGQLKIKSAA